MGGMIACDRVYLYAVSMSSLSCASSLVDETPGEGVYDAWVPFGGGSVFRLKKGVQRKLIPACPIFQVLRSQNNQYHKVSYFNKVTYLDNWGWHVLNSYNHILGWHILLPFTVLFVWNLFCVSLVPDGYQLSWYLDIMNWLDPVFP